MTFQMKMQDTFRQGKAEGRAEGIENTKTAVKMLFARKSLKQIIETTGFQESELCELATHLEVEVNRP